MTKKKFYKEDELVFVEKPDNPRFADLTGQKFNRLTILGYAGNKRWYAKCSCQEQNIIAVIGYSAKAGKTKSCGCIQKQAVINNCKKDIDHYKTVLKDSIPTYEIVKQGFNYGSSDWELFCTVCDDVFTGRISSALRGSYICPCSGKIKHSEESLQERAKEFCSKYNLNFEGIFGEYLGTRTKIKTSCRTCGHKDNKLYTNLMQGKGCAGCSAIALRNRVKKDHSYYIEKAESVHGGKYSYELVNKDALCRDKVKIFCKEHETYFDQSWDNHINKSKGCPLCANAEKKGVHNPTTVERNKTKYLKEKSGVYFVHIKDNLYKIGVTKNLRPRLLAIKRESGIETVETILYREFNLYLSCKLEEYLHNLLNSKKYKENLNFCGWTEVFELSQKEVDFVNKFLSDVKEDCFG